MRADAMKLVGLMSVKNEDWVLGLSLRAAALLVDEMVVLDHASTDQTTAVLVAVAREHRGRIHVLTESDPVWRESEIRQRLLESGRERGASHFCLFDADEVLSGNLLPAMRPKIASLAPGEGLWLPWLELWGSLDRYRSDSSGRLQEPMIFAFRDAPGVDFRAPDGPFNIHTRVPDGLTGQTWGAVDQPAGGVLHLAYLPRRRMAAKAAWYKMVETIYFPGRYTPLELNRSYHVSGAEKGVMTAPVDPGWWAPYAPWFEHLDLTAAPWQERECRRLWQEHGAATFAGLELGGLPQAEVGELGDQQIWSGNSLTSSSRTKVIG